jgi:hypothetical protein
LGLYDTPQARVVAAGQPQTGSLATRRQLDKIRDLASLELERQAELSSDPSQRTVVTGELAPKDGSKQISGGGSLFEGSQKFVEEEEDSAGMNRDALKGVSRLELEDVSRLEFDKMTQVATLKQLQEAARGQTIKLIPYLDPERYTALGRKPDP